MACSSLYQSLMVSPGVAGTPPIGLNVRSTSLSLKVTFVRWSLLENGYMIEQFVIGQLVVLTLARWLQQPAWHAGVVHASPSVSVHGEPSATLVCEQVPAASQKSFVHSLLSLHLAVCMQLPVAGSQLSFVHGSLSLQVRVVFTQPVVGSCRVFDGSHPSSVQALLSLHAASLRPCWQPFTASQVSVVHEKPSSQAPLLGECWQPWAVQVSVVQATPSSQAPLLGECWQPWAVQVSVVQATPSSPAPLLVEGWQPLTTSQVSVVQATPSSQVPLLGECWQPLTASQVSVVHATPSSQRPEVAVDEHTPSWTPLDLAGSQKLSVHCVSAGQNSTVLASSVCARGTSGSSMARVWENAAM